MLRQAPHLTHPLPTILPCYQWWEVPFYWVGLKFYDAIAAMGHGSLYLSKYYSSAEARRLFPTLSPLRADKKPLRGAIVYFDGQMNDARVNVSVALTAALYGAAVAESYGGHWTLEEFKKWKGQWSKSKRPPNWRRV
ncbi:Glycerol-3-phosphate dehydrogenase SDP6, mitochondrial [Galdieria sulphuraria]|nr:Glycerol-3-phosphate dehydrogenase SDP6, mitochondrial [Galdieria sulphuraria]